MREITTTKEFLELFYERLFFGGQCKTTTRKHERISQPLFCKSQKLTRNTNVTLEHREMV